MLSLLHHSNLVNLIGYCADGDQRLLVYEYMALGSLEDHLHGKIFFSHYFVSFQWNWIHILMKHGLDRVRPAHLKPILILKGLYPARPLGGPLNKSPPSMIELFC